MYLNLFLGGSDAGLGLSDRGVVVEVRGRVERGLLDAGLRGVAGARFIVVGNNRDQNGLRRPA